MGPWEYYHDLAESITDENIRLVASYICAHVGEENAVDMKQMSEEVGMGERQIRKILETLTDFYGIPVGAYSGRSGRWVIATEAERDRVLSDLRARMTALQLRITAISNAKLPPENALDCEPSQPVLLDVPEPERPRLNYWDN